MYFDRFDVCEAWYLFLSQYHGGQGSRFYSRLSAMGSYFTARPSLHETTLSENAVEIYNDLVLRFEAGTLRD